MSSGYYKVKASPRFKELEKPQIGEKLDFGEIVRRQIDRCLLNAADETAFAQHVKALEALIPATNITEDYLREAEDCSETYEFATPVTCCGVPVRGDILAESKQEVVETDWYGRLQAAINLFTSMGITWRRIPATGF